MQVSTIGIDLAKNVFQVHGVDAAGKVVITKKLRRSQMRALFEKLPPCLVGMEACATAHHWARELKALGHDVRLMPASYVKAYVKRGKNDAADAAAICEAVTRPSMRFVPVKTTEQQSALMLHRTRDLLVRHPPPPGRARTGCRAGRDGLKTLISAVTNEASRLPDLARKALQALLSQLNALAQQIGEIERHVHALHRSSEASQRLETIPGIGVIGATAIAATVSDPTVFKSGREFAAWIGLAASELQRRQGAVGLDIQAGRSQSALLARRRRHGSHTARAGSPRQASLAHAAVGAATGKAGGGGARQQDGPHRLGGAGER